MAVPNVSELLTVTINSRTRKLADNVSNNNALLRELKKRGRIKTASGGPQIYQELAFQEGGTYTRYSGYDTININPTDQFSAAVFDWKQAAVAVSISGREMLINSNKEKMIDLLESRIENAEREFMNNMSTDIYSDGTASSSKQVGGLQLIVADAPTSGTVGGIDRASYSFWQNKLYDFSVESATASSTTIQTAMNTLWLRTKRGTDTINLIVFDDVYYTFYWNSLQANQRFTSAESASAGFAELSYKGNIPVLCDGGQGGACPASHGYFLNANYLHWRPHVDRNYVALEPDRFATNQDAVVKLIGWMGNMTASNCALQGVMHA